MSLYNNVIRNVNKEEKDDDEKLGYEFWNKVENAPVIKQIKNYFQQNNENIQAYNEYARSKENDNLLSRGLAWTAYGLEQTVAAPFRLIDMGLEEISDRTNIDKRSLKLGLDLIIAAKGVRGSKTDSFNRGVRTRQNINKQYNKFANIFKKPGDQLIDIKATQLFDDVAKLSINDAKIARLLNPIFTAEELGLDPSGTTFFSVNEPINDQSNLDLGIGDVGIPGYKKSSITKISTPEFIDKRFKEYGFTKLGPNGGWIFDPKVYNSLKDHQKREIAQIMQTDISQTVPHSFSKEVNVKNLELNTKLAEYNKKYGARAELHHDFPSALDARFWFNVEYMSDEWKILKSVANEYGNYPGQPIVDGQTNLYSLPSKIGKNHPNYYIVQERFGNVPPHLHNIIHSQFFANETGMSGDKFFTPARVNKMEASFEGKVEVFREWNEIVVRNRELWTEGLRQLDVFFSEIPLENTDDLVNMLEEYLANDLIKIGSGNVRDRFGNLVKTPDGELVNVDYAQFSVQDIVSNALADFKVDFKNDILGKNPRFKEVETEVRKFSHLSEGEVLDMANVLYKIKHYNGLKMLYGTKRAGEMVFGKGKNVKYYNEHLELYMGLIDEALPNDTPTIITLEQLKQTTFKDLVKPTIHEQLKILFPD